MLKQNSRATGAIEVAAEGMEESVRRHAVALAVSDLLVAIGDDPSREGLRDTPAVRPLIRLSYSCFFVFLF